MSNEINTQGAYNFRLGVELFSEYCERYTRVTLAEYLRKCVQRAVDSRTFFDDVFFAHGAMCEKNK